MRTSAAVQSLAERLRTVRARIDERARRVNRDPKEITLVAVSKTHPVSVIREALAAGATDLGENRVQEADSKIHELRNEHARWHLIGHLQSNKAKRAVELFDVIHSLDSVELAQRLERISHELEKKELPVLIQVDLGHEATKSGAREEDLPSIVETVAQAERLRLIGLMTLPPFFDDAEQARPFFGRLRDLRDRLKGMGAFGDARGELSMGMTHDFEVAIEEGATMLRIGTAIFGEREKIV